jgi:tryptophan synthase alpha chain
MSRIADAFAAAAARGQTALIPYLTAGYPSPDETVGLVRAAVEGGADIVELGVPFSDPMGDGPVIQASTQAALRAGTTTARVLQLVAAARAEGIETPIVLMGYCNPFLRYGLKRLYEDARVAGADGLIVPDLPAHLADDWIANAATAGLDTIFFAAPGSPLERLRYTAGRAGGFLYCIATDGVTGARDELDPRLMDFLARTRSVTSLPLAVGFGISRPAQVAQLHGHADGVIVGSALLRRVAAAPDPASRITATTDLLGELKAACR